MAQRVEAGSARPAPWPVGRDRPGVADRPAAVELESRCLVSGPTSPAAEGSAHGYDMGAGWLFHRTELAASGELAFSVRLCEVHAA
jgi:hypothetical protein